MDLCTFGFLETQAWLAAAKWIDSGFKTATDWPFQSASNEYLCGVHKSRSVPRAYLCTQLCRKWHAYCYPKNSAFRRQGWIRLLQLRNICRRSSTIFRAWSKSHLRIALTSSDVTHCSYCTRRGGWVFRALEHTTATSWLPCRWNGCNCASIIVIQAVSTGVICLNKVATTWSLKELGLTELTTLHAPRN